MRETASSRTCSKSKEADLIIKCNNESDSSIQAMTYQHLGSQSSNKWCYCPLRMTFPCNYSFLPVALDQVISLDTA